MNIPCTLHDANADRPLDLYRFFRDDTGASLIQSIPIVTRGTLQRLASGNEGVR